MRWARSIFLQVIGKKAPALTVASLAMTITVPALDRADAGDDAGRRGAAPVAVHAVGGPEAQLEEVGAGVEQTADALAGGEAALGVLALDRLGAAALADRLFLAAERFDHLGEFVGHGVDLLSYQPRARASGLTETARSRSRLVFQAMLFRPHAQRDVVLIRRRRQRPQAAVVVEVLGLLDGPGLRVHPLRLVRPLR